MDEGLLNYCCSVIEKTYLTAIMEHATQEKAGEALGVTRNAITKALRRVKKRAAKMGYSPEHDMTKTTPEGFHVKGVSTYYDDEGKVRGQWVKTNKDKEETLELLKDAVDAIIEPCRGLAKPIKRPVKTITNKMATYPIAEPHMGMYSWDKETGDDYDLDIAETILIDSMRELVDSAPQSKKGLIVNLADYFHADNESNQTAASGNVLDVDGRWGKVFQVGVRAKRAVINMALEKHDEVEVISGLGNHDKHSIFCLMMMMQAYFENEPRVKIHLPNNPFAYYQFGKNLIGLHHGNGVKPADLPLIMATDKPKEWGKALYRHFMYGHIHHKVVKEHAGCMTESFRSIATKDSWHNSKGYRAGRAMEAIVYHEDGGEHSRQIVHVRQGGLNGQNV